MSRPISIIFAAITLLFAPACGGGGGGARGGQDDGGITSSGGASGPSADSGAVATGGFHFGGGCQNGAACDDGGVCAGGLCCERARACAHSCCEGSEVCSFQTCVTPGSTCTDSSDCQASEYCESSLGEQADAVVSDGTTCVGGRPVLTGRCLPRPPICAPGTNGTAGETCVERCEVVPSDIAFDPVVKYSWGGETAPPYSTDVMMTPIVVQLDDDNCDGKVNADDIPEILFSTFTGGAYHEAGTLHAISVDHGAIVEKWTKPGAIHGSSQLAAGDLDADGVAEVVACLPPAPGGADCCDAQAENTGVIAFKADGSVLWTQADTTRVHCGYEAIAIADPKHTGQPQVLVGLTLLDGKTGAIDKELDPATGWGARITGFSDVDVDGDLDIVEGRRAFDADGTVLWDLSAGADIIAPGYHAVGDLDNDGKPEVALVSRGTHTMQIVSHDSASPSGARVIRRDIDINNGISTAGFCNRASEYGGGAPTIADFDGDGFPDVGAAGAAGYAVLSGRRLMDMSVPSSSTVLWFKETHDCSSGFTGSAVFDFNGDGSSEVVYGDEIHLWIYDGASGQNLIPETCNTSGTLWEYPVVADVDNDGQADIVIASNAFGSISCNGTKQSGIRILGSQSGSWVRTRRIWNQHSYHVTNVDEDGRIPRNEVTNYTTSGLNNYRQNKQPGGEFSAADAVVTLTPSCSGQFGLIATVRNMGQAVLPPGQTLTFYSGTAPGTEIGRLDTTQPLGPAQGENLFLPLPTPPPGVREGSTPVYVTVTVRAPTVQCRLDNDSSAETSAECSIIQ